MVHDADVSKEPTGLSAGVKAILSGLRLVAGDDQEALRVGFKIWDSMYAYFVLRDLEKKYSGELSGMDRIGRLKFLREKVQSLLPGR